MGQVLTYLKPSEPTEDKNIIFAYDLKSTSKHFIAGTLVINHVDELTRFDDFEIIKRKKGLEIKSIGIYRAQNRIIGYEITYKDAANSSFTLKRIPSRFNAFRNKTCVSLKLQYNEHLVDIDLVYTQDDIKYIEIMTSKGNTLKVGTQVEDGYTSFNKVDITQKNYAAIIAFETTFSKDCLKELFIYRCPVRITKKKKKRKLTVMEINNLKKAPSYESAARAKKNIENLREFTRKGIDQLRVVKAFQSTLQTKEVNKPSSNKVLPKFKDYFEDRKVQEDYMEEQEYGAGEEEEDEPKDTKEAKPERNSIVRASKRIITGFTALAQRRSSQMNPPVEKINSASPLKRITANFFAWRANSSGKFPSKELNIVIGDSSESPSPEKGSESALLRREKRANTTNRMDLKPLEKIPLNFRKSSSPDPKDIEPSSNLLIKNLVKAE